MGLCSDLMVQRRLRQVLIYPLQNEGPHLWQFDVFAIEQLDTDIGLSSMLSIERKQVITDFLHPFGRSQRIPPTIHAKVRSRYDQFINVCFREVFRQRGKEIIEAGFFEPWGSDSLLVSGRQANVKQALTPRSTR